MLLKYKLIVIFFAAARAPLQTRTGLYVTFLPIPVILQAKPLKHPNRIIYGALNKIKDFRGPIKCWKRNENF